MSLGDHFPENHRDDFAGRSLEVGMVLKLFVKDTKPPKEKRFIIVGITEDRLSLAIVYINSQISKFAQLSQDIMCQYVEFESKGVSSPFLLPAINVIDFEVYTR